MRAARMRLAISVTAALAIPAIAATGVEASGHHHVRKHHHSTTAGWNGQARRSWTQGTVQQTAPRWNGTGDVCPGNARGIDCKIWPPPIDADPDRRQPGTDGGG